MIYQIVKLYYRRNTHNKKEGKYQAMATRLGECRQVWRVRHISEKGHFG
jgi:hypothetical protein